MAFRTDYHEVALSSTSLFTIFFRVLSTSQVVYRRRETDKKSLVYCSARVIGVKVISLSYIISLFTYIQRVRFGSRVRQEGKKIFQLRKSWLLCLTLTLSHYQDCIYFLSQVFWWRNDKILCSGKKKRFQRKCRQSWVEICWKLFDAKMSQGSPRLAKKHDALVVKINEVFSQVLCCPYHASIYFIRNITRSG